MSDEQKQFPIEEKITRFRKVASNNGVNWLNQAFLLFKKNPLTWFSSIILMFIMLFTMMLIPVIQFFSIVLTPVFTAGLMFACNNLRNNRPFKLAQLFSGFNQNLNSLLIIGLVYLGYTLLCSFIAVELSEFLGRPLMQLSQEMLTSGTLDIQAFLESLLLPTLILMALMLPMFMATWFAPALVALRNVKAIEAMRQSYLACAANLKPFTIFGLAAFVAMFLLVIIISLFSALVPALSVLLKLMSNLFLMSILVATMFTSFEDIFFLEDSNENDKGGLDTSESSDDHDGPSSIIL